jgi:hypothetical protein
MDILNVTFLKIMLRSVFINVINGNVTMYCPMRYAVIIRKKFVMYN